MSTKILELSDVSRNETSIRSNLLENKLNNNKDESIETKSINKENHSSKFYLLSKQYLQQLKLVFRSIIPDLQSFKYWHIIILVFFAIFNVIFSILVSNKK